MAILIMSHGELNYFKNVSSPLFCKNLKLSFQTTLPLIQVVSGVTVVFFWGTYYVWDLDYEPQSLVLECAAEISPQMLTFITTY